MEASINIDRIHIRQRSDLVSLCLVVAHLALVIAPIYLAAVSGPSWTIFVFWLWFGLLQHGLTNLMHETAHKHVFARSYWNEILGHWILGPFFIADFGLYRARHWVHHRETGTDRDTKITYLISLKSHGAVIFFARAFLGVEAVKKFLIPFQQKRQIKQTDSPRDLKFFITLLVFHAVFISSLFAAAWLSASGDIKMAAIRFACAYGFVYLYGMASLTIIMATLRSIAEHQKTDDTQETGNAAIRNLRCGPTGRLLLGCYGFSDHGTHHRYPMIPAYNLPLLTAELGAIASLYKPTDSYWSILRRLMRSQ